MFLVFHFNISKINFQDVIKLVGKVNFPNIRFLEQQVDFKCIRNFSIESKTFQAENVTPLLVCYKFLWKTVEIADIEPVKDLLLN